MMRIKTCFGPFSGGEFMPAVVDGRDVDMGDGYPQTWTDVCRIHGEQFHLAGLNEGGNEGMSVCLKCCALLYEKLAPPSED